MGADGGGRVRVLGSKPHSEQARDFSECLVSRLAVNLVGCDNGFYGQSDGRRRATKLGERHVWRETLHPNVCGDIGLFWFHRKRGADAVGTAILRTFLSFRPYSSHE